MMKKPIQLIVNDELLPNQVRDRYKCYPRVLSELLEMIAGNMVEEIKGTVQIIEYSCDALRDEEYKRILAALRRPGPLRVAYLPDDGSTDLITSEFLIENFTPPTLGFFRGPTPVWHNMSFTLRETKPHDEFSRW